MSDPNKTPAEVQFDTSSRFEYPGGWKIRNNYPRVDDPAPPDEKPWIDICFKKNPEDYANALLKYVHEGNIEHNFDVWKNKIRDWYHPPWLHYGDKGREPVNGLHYGGPILPTRLGKYQDRYLQGWLNGYYNREAATLLGKIWGDPNDPCWNKGILFGPGSVLCENVFVDDDDGAITYLKGAPEVDALIAVRPPDPHTKPDPSKRLDKPVRLRLLQSDVLAKDCRSPTGWVFASFIHDSTKKNLDAPNPWNNLIPVGVQWGNDPSLDQTAHDKGILPSECWINTRALEIIDSQKGDAPWLGWHGRLNGPVDNFISTCASCHAVAQIVPESVKDPSGPIQSPTPKKVPPEDGRPGVWIQEDERGQKWFRNLKDGQPFDPGCISTDYSQQVRIGIENYELWRRTKP